MPRLNPVGVPTPFSEARFWETTIPEPNTGCWLWLGAVNKGGYGTLYFNGQTRMAHRVAAMLANNLNTVMSNYFDNLVLHKCDMRCCVNPGHLYIGTQSDNMQDAIRRGRKDFTSLNDPAVKCRGSSHPQAKLVEEQVKQIRSLYSGGCYTFRELGAVFGVSSSVVFNIVHRLTWEHVE